MNIGKQARLNRLFSHPSGRLCSVAVDHFINYNIGIPPGLSDIARTLREIVENQGRAMEAAQQRGALPPAFTAAECTAGTLITGADGVIHTKWYFRSNRVWAEVR